MLVYLIHYSKEVKLLIERHHVSNPCLDSILLGSLAACALLVVGSLSSASIANEHIELSNLVRILTRSRHLDWTCPVEVTVAKSKRKLLDLDLFQGAFVERHKAMCGQDTTLVGSSGCDEEVERLRIVSVASSMLNQVLIDDAAAWWVLQLTSRVLHEEPLVDALVHHNKSDLRLPRVFRVELLDSLFEL